MRSGSNIVVVGAGQAGIQFAVSLRQAGFQERIQVLGSERNLPYQRPPLSKSFLIEDLDADDLTLFSGQELDELGIELELDCPVVSIDRHARRMETGRGHIEYRSAVLSTGSRNRQFLETNLEGVCCLRGLEEAAELKDRLYSTGRIVIVGAGFLGMEVAAAARQVGLSVHVVEPTHRVLGRSTNVEVSESLARTHRDAGVELHLGVGARSLLSGKGRVQGVELEDGTKIASDLVLIAVGVKANDELAQNSGLPVADGILVDEFLATQDPCVFSIGDCARAPSRFTGGTARMESVQNSGDQALLLAQNLVGEKKPYHSVPWFWTEQFGQRMQAAGFPALGDQTILRGDQPDGAFSVYSFRDDRLIGVSSLNRPADHLQARRLLSSGRALSRAEFIAPDFVAGDWLKQGLAA